MEAIKLVAVQGHKNSGKTRLAVMLIEEFRRRGYRVASAKHVHHRGFSVDQRGKDSWKHMEAGANPSAIISPDEVAVIWRGKNVKSIEEILELVGEADILVLEGFYGMLAERRDAVKIILLKDESEVGQLRGDIRASFRDLGYPGIYKLPEQFYELFSELLSKLT